MLPRSFLSASSLKNGLEEISTSSNKRRRSTTYRKDVLESDSSTDSSSDSDNELPDIYETYSEAYLYNDIGALLNQIQHQQTKHRKHLKRAITLEKTIRKNTKKLSLLTRLLIKKQHQHQTLEPSLSPTNASLKIPAKRESRSNQLLSAPSIQVSPAPSTKIKATSSSLLMDTSEAEPSRRKHQVSQTKRSSYSYSFTKAFFPFLNIYIYIHVE
ncbi:hypothetical protein BC941DRAFT_224215 [Chlamydoabsidia padenii]|nr:hypothetical protein BC941DRAFT_224215 [Chlamydoabsidia padenii]